ncbi:MAG: zeta toxin family protein [Bacteroidota bacterium]
MPNVYIIGGPNGAGKTTVALKLFPDILPSREFVNADFIAQGLSAFNVESVAFAAGRLMLERLIGLRSQKKDFAFESTLASRTFVPFLKECKEDGYKVNLTYVWIGSAELAKERIGERAKQGGHRIPEEVIERRYGRSVENFRNLYLPLADAWRIFDNTYPELGLVGYKNVGGDFVTLLPERMEGIMKGQIREPEGEYSADKIFLAAKAAIQEELDRKRKLGLPIVFGKDGKIIVMVGEKVVKEKPLCEDQKIVS